MFCDKFRKLRLKNNYTQSELAKKLNVSQPTIASWEAGKRIPKWKSIKKIAEILMFLRNPLLMKRRKKRKLKQFLQQGKILRI